VCVCVCVCVCVHACSQEMSYRATLSASELMPLFIELMSCAWRCWVCESELMSCVWRAWPSCTRLIPSTRGFSSALRALKSMFNIIDEKKFLPSNTENPCRPVHPHQDVSSTVFPSNHVVTEYYLPRTGSQDPAFISL